MASELENRLKAHVFEKLTQAGINEDFKADIAEYVAMLIPSNKPANEISTEVSEASGENISVAFIEDIKRDFDQLQNASQPASSQVQAPDAAAPAQQQQGFSSFAPSDFSSTKSFQPLQKYPRNFNHGAVRKNFGNKRGNFAMNNNGNPAMIQKALADLLNMGSDNKKKTRCNQYPRCTNRDCRFVHPSKKCFQFPNCPNPKGTCGYLHPGEDDEIFKEYEQFKAEMDQKNQEKLQQQNGISLCHKGANCFFSACKFAHPTKANQSNEVNVWEWCPAGRDCSDVNCHRAHQSYKTKEEVISSGQFVPGKGGKFGNASKFNKIAQLASALSSQMPVEHSLEQCKFGAKCMNPRCKFRHASTPVLCRDGQNCTRVDCYFTHPLNQDCKYSVNCKNKFCSYKHPPERDAMINKPLVWTANGSHNAPSGTSNAPNTPSTNERTFAVPNDQVLERAPPQDDAQMTV